MTCGVEDQPKSLLKSPIPVVQTLVDRQGGPQPDHPERSSCKLVLRELSFPFSLELLEACFLHHRGDSLPTPPQSWPLGDPCEKLAKGDPLFFSFFFFA